jgi:hypothetical protein
MATTCGVSVTKNADGSFKFTSSDATNGVGWIVNSGAFDIVDDLTGVQEPLWQELLRQIKQITTIG